MARSGRWGVKARGVCAAIIATGDLLLRSARVHDGDGGDGDGGDEEAGGRCCTEAEADAVLAAHCAAAPNFRGLRFFGGKVERFPFHNAVAVDAVLAAMAKRGLVLDVNGPENAAALTFAATLGAIAQLAARHPLLRVVVDHCGGAVGPALSADKIDEWRAAMRVLQALPNVYVKASGLQMAANGFGLTRAEGRTAPPIGSDELATKTFPFYAFIIGLFGASRVMFASNFPVDKAGVGYGVLWNAFKRIARRLELDEVEIGALFSGTARSVYSL
jgi:predicted TIM-barrel fold metal-dependent hydrolase